jgi:hypothetical protein
VKIISKKDVGQQIHIKLHELFGVEVESTNPNNEYLAVPSFVKEQNYAIIKEYNYWGKTPKTGTQAIGKRIYLLLATKVSRIDISWYNLSTAEEELHFILNVSSDDTTFSEEGYAVSDADMDTQPNASSNSDVVLK